MFQRALEIMGFPFFPSQHKPHTPLINLHCLIQLSLAMYGYAKLNFNLIIFKNSVPLLHWLHFESTTTICHQWLLNWNRLSINAQLYGIAPPNTCPSVPLSKSACRFWQKPFHTSGKALGFVHPSTFTLQTLIYLQGTNYISNFISSTLICSSQTLLNFV